MASGTEEGKEESKERENGGRWSEGGIPLIRKGFLIFL